VIKKLEILANICVVITSVVLCSVLIKKYVLSSSKPEAPVEAVQSKPPASNPSRRPSIQAGTKITLPGLEQEYPHCGTCAFHYVPLLF
jgi:hypothetical protein